MADAIRWLTYAELAETLGIGPDSARNLVRRKRWSRQTGNDGLARIGVPVERLEAQAEAKRGDEGDVPSDGPTAPPSDTAINGPSSPPSDAPTDGTIIALQILREHIARLEAEVVSLKDECARERARAAQVEALTAVLDLERKRAEETRQERDRWASALEASQRQIAEMTRRPARGLFGWFRRDVA
jgi:hypothetical protein